GCWAAWGSNSPESSTAAVASAPTGLRCTCSARRSGGLPPEAAAPSLGAADAVEPTVLVVDEPRLAVLVLAKRRHRAVPGRDAAVDRLHLQRAAGREPAHEQLARAGVGEDIGTAQRGQRAVVHEATGDRAAAIDATIVVEHGSRRAGSPRAVGGAGRGIVMAALAGRVTEVAGVAGAEP